MKKRGSLAYPGHDVDTFIKWYKIIMNDYKKYKKSSKNIISLKYENFILNHEKESKKLLKFLGLKKTQSKFFNLQTSKKNVYKAHFFLNKKELLKIEKNLKKFLQWPKIILS